MSYELWMKFSNGQDSTETVELRDVKKAWEDTLNRDSVVEAKLTDTGENRVVYHYEKPE